MWHIKLFEAEHIYIGLLKRKKLVYSLMNPILLMVIEYIMNRNVESPRKISKVI